MCISFHKISEMSYGLLNISLVHLLSFYLAPPCPKLPSPANGKVTISGQGTSAAVASYECNRGFSLIGSSSRSCSNGVWLGTAPVCQGKVFISYLVNNREINDESQ